MKYYTAAIMDSDGLTITSYYECEGLKQAKQRAKYLASSEYARNSEHAHSDGDHVVVTEDSTGNIVIDVPCEVAVGA